MIFSYLYLKFEFLASLQSLCLIYLPLLHVHLSYIVAFQFTNYVLTHGIHNCMDSQRSLALRLERKQNLVRPKGHHRINRYHDENGRKIYDISLFAYFQHIPVINTLVVASIVKEVQVIPILNIDSEFLAF